MNYNCIVVLGPTASGKTRLACELADRLNGEIISADSRQVYKHLNIGTGKDLHEYLINGKKIPYHLINYCEPGEQFYLHDWIRECEKAFENIRNRNNLPVICGGTGLYLDSLRKDTRFTQIKENETLRDSLNKLSNNELVIALKKYPPELTAHVDVNSRKRVIRALEIAQFLKENPSYLTEEKKIYNPFYIGVNVSADERKKRISERLIHRINTGLIDEAKELIDSGMNYERLMFLGLEYRFLALYLQQKMNKEEMISQLQTAIIQFSKRQMTWFRKMEKEGVKIHWVSRDEAIESIIQKFKSANY